MEKGAYARLGNQALSVGLAAKSVVAIRCALTVDPQGEAERAGLVQALEVRRAQRVIKGYGGNLVLLSWGQ